jgi:calcium-dependent protein kinase
MAPEIIKGFFTDKCDLWSCGVILYILLISKSPFKCKKKEETIQKILNHEIDYEDIIWNDISANAKDLVKKLLDKDPFRRISADHALKHSWFLNNRERVQAKNTEFIKSLSNYYVIMP